MLLENTALKNFSVVNIQGCLSHTGAETAFSYPRQHQTLPLTPSHLLTCAVCVGLLHNQRDEFTIQSEFTPGYSVQRMKLWFCDKTSSYVFKSFIMLCTEKKTN